MNRLVRLSDSFGLTLTAPVASPAVGDGWLWSPGQRWSAPDPRASRLSAGIDAHAATALGSDHLGIVADDFVAWLDLSAAVGPRFSAAPVPEPPALGSGWLAWVQAGAGFDVWTVGSAEGPPRGEPRMLAGGAGDQHLLASAGEVLAWVDNGDVVRHNIADGSTLRFDADAGFAAPPTVSALGRVCWEDRRALRTGGDVDIWCDGQPLVRAGDQRWPSFAGERLIWREGEQVLVGTISP